MWALIGVFGVLALIILCFIYGTREVYRCDRCGKVGLRPTRPSESGEEISRVTREYTCKYCGHTAWMQDPDIPQIY